MARTPSGTTLWVASTIAASKATTIVTNAAEAVVTSVAHGYTNGDIVEIQSGWGRLHKRAFRIKGVTVDTFTLEGADTTSTTFFPAGTGVGSVRKVSAWTQITTVMNPQSSGGEPKQVNYKFLESDVEYTINDGFTPITRSFNIDADSIGSPGYTALKTLTDVQTDTIMRNIAKSGAITLLPCTVALNEEEVMQEGQVTMLRVSVSGNNRSTRYAS
ncbi:phage tail tube protein [Hydrogenophaga atypica]|uniref:Phage tail tube protein n=1 Tax=Hydrogenophaga atypica TaxID=249409 RepID=A0ABW2QHI0_9BURK